MFSLQWENHMMPTDSNFSFVFSVFIICTDFTTYILLLCQCNAKYDNRNITLREGMCSIRRKIFVLYKNTSKRNVKKIFKFSEGFQEDGRVGGD